MFSLKNSQLQFPVSKEIFLLDSWKESSGMSIYKRPKSAGGGGAETETVRGKTFSLNINNTDSINIY